MANRTRDPLKRDRRLLYRPGWLSDEERQALLDSLPDVAEKGVRLGEESPEDAAPGGTSPQEPGE